ncbi:hypothetical protein CKA32_002351 [Geitlerinema sp. FC II]|nr:hypothetical protein CKA32_002351 [Geitlerinema sp. FC II]
MNNGLTFGCRTDKVDRWRAESGRADNKLNPASTQLPGWKTATSESFR